MKKIRNKTEARTKSENKFRLVVNQTHAFQKNRMRAIFSDIDTSFINDRVDKPRGSSFNDVTQVPYAHCIGAKKFRVMQRKKVS